MLVIQKDYYNDLISINTIEIFTDIGNTPRHVNCSNYSNKSLPALKKLLRSTKRKKK